MYSDDVYRARLRSAVADLKQALAPLSGVADIEIAMTGDSARVSLTPHANGACPVELMLRADQRYDIAVASALDEDRPIERLELFAPLILAIAGGAVIERHLFSAQTGAEVGRQTIVHLPDGSTWHMGASHGTPATEPLQRDRRFLPYRR